MVMVANQIDFELGHYATAYPGSLGHLYSTGKGAVPAPWDWMPYALDNGAYGAHKNKREWDEAEWRELLRWAALSGVRPLWAVVPDAVGERAVTLERWARHVGDVRRYGFRPAFAAQDGMTFDDVPDRDCVIFIGGTDDWKDAAIAPWCRAFPGRVHVARVNGWERLNACHRAGAISVDGTGWFHRHNSRAGGQRAALVRYIKETSIEVPRRIAV